MKNTMKKTSKVHFISLIGAVISFLILIIHFFLLSDLLRGRIRKLYPELSVPSGSFG